MVDQASFDHLFEPGGRLPPGDYGLHVLFNANATIRNDPRFVRLCAKLGLRDYWVNTGRWPDCADTVALRLPPPSPGWVGSSPSLPPQRRIEPGPTS